MESVELTREFLASQDAILIATDHSEVDYQLIVDNASLVVDTRNVTQGLSPVKDNIRRC